jgi:hypothetical protein
MEDDSLWFCFVTSCFVFMHPLSHINRQNINTKLFEEAVITMFRSVAILALLALGSPGVLAVDSFAAGRKYSVGLAYLSPDDWRVSLNSPCALL